MPMTPATRDVREALLLVAQDLEVRSGSKEEVDKLAANLMAANLDRDLLSSTIMMHQMSLHTVSETLKAVADKMSEYID